MKTRIRLSRSGGRSKPYYRIVVSAVARPRDGKFLDIVGVYDPHEGVGKARVEKEKVDLWLKRGAQPSEIVRQILKHQSSRGGEG